MIAIDRRRILIFATLTALSVAFWTWRLAPTVPTSSDAFEYISLAESLRTDGAFALGDPPAPTAYREPGYPAFLAAVFAMSGGVSLAGVIIAQWLLLTACVWAFSSLLRRFAPDDARWATWLPAALALSPILGQYAGLFLTELPQAALLLVALLLTVEALERADTRWAAIAGAVWAALVVTRFTWLFLPFIVAAWIWLKHGRKRIALLIAALPAAAVLVWCLRNGLALGKFTFTSRAGHTSYVRAIKTGLPEAVRASYYRAAILGSAFEKRRDPSFDYQAVSGWADYERYHDGRQAAGASDEAIDTELGREAMKLALAHPARYAVDGAVEVWKLMTPLAFSGPTTHTFITRADRSPFWPYALVLAALRLWTLLKIVLLAWGAAAAWKRGWAGQLAALAVLYQAAIYSFFESLPRFAIPIQPLILLLICGACYDAYQRTHARR
jgi:4-amino-4-deoxy-L-arabinose transferase-like glycosyltransferase